MHSAPEKHLSSVTRKFVPSLSVIVEESEGDLISQTSPANCAILLSVTAKEQEEHAIFQTLPANSASNLCVTVEGPEDTAIARTPPQNPVVLERATPSRPFMDTEHLIRGVSSLFDDEDDYFTHLTSTSEPTIPQEPVPVWMRRLDSDDHARGSSQIQRKTVSHRRVNVSGGEHRMPPSAYP